MRLLSVNMGRLKSVEYTDAPSGGTGIEKQPVEGAVRVAAPGPKGSAGSGLVGDVVSDLRHHSGDDHAVYAFAREDLDAWQRELGRPLADGASGENLTTSGVDVSGARIGERWWVGPDVVLEVTSSRIPCSTSAGHLGEEGWVRRFTQNGAPGAYLRVVQPGEIRAGDVIEIVYAPDHEVTVALQFRSATTERALLPQVLAAGSALHPESVADARAYLEKYGNPE